MIKLCKPRRAASSGRADFCFPSWCVAGDVNIAEEMLMPECVSAWCWGALGCCCSRLLSSHSCDRRLNLSCLFPPRSTCRGSSTSRVYGSFSPLGFLQYGFLVFWLFQLVSLSLDWILGKKTLLKEWSGTGRGCPGQWWSPHPWKGSKNVWMWHFGIWFSRHGGVGLTVGLDDLRGLFQP